MILSDIYELIKTASAFLFVGLSGYIFASAVLAPLLQTHSEVEGGGAHSRWACSSSLPCAQHVYSDISYSKRGHYIYQIHNEENECVLSENALFCRSSKRERTDKRRDLSLFFEQEDRSMPSAPMICCDSRAPAQLSFLKHRVSFVHLFLLVCVQETRRETG